MPPSCNSIKDAVAAVMVAALINGCSSTSRSSVDITERVIGTPDATAVARMGAVPGSPVEGRVTFAQFGSIVVVRANFIGLAPGREYGLHVHEKGDCRGDDASAAGAHFNPGGAPHGRPGSGAHHVGDLPKLGTDGEGNVLYVFTTEVFSVAAGPNSVVNRSVIVTRDPDDYSTQPDGKSGPPLACGLIRPK